MTGSSHLHPLQSYLGPTQRLREGGGTIFSLVNTVLITKIRAPVIVVVMVVAVGGPVGGERARTLRAGEPLAPSLKVVLNVIKSKCTHAFHR